MSNYFRSKRICLSRICLNKIWLCVICLLIAIFLAQCATVRQYDFSLHNTLAIFMLENDRGHFFCIPIQYMGDYQIGMFNFNGGAITIGDYEILTGRETVNIYIYLNENPDEYGSVNSGEFRLIYSEENGVVLISEMNKPLTVKEDADEMNHYYIFIERFLTDEELVNITGEYKKGNVISGMIVEYDLIINNELQAGNGILDDFELCNEPAISVSFFPPNLDFFKVKYGNL